MLSGSPVKGVSIATSTNAAYELMKQGQRVSEGGYEVIDVHQRGATLTSVEAAYEVPSVHDQPLPDIPPPNEASEEVEEEGVYEAIPGDH